MSRLNIPQPELDAIVAKSIDKMTAHLTPRERDAAGAIGLSLYKVILTANAAMAPAFGERNRRRIIEASLAMLLASLRDAIEANGGVI